MGFKCKDCKDRAPGCWSSCESYQQEVRERARLKELKDKEEEYYGYKSRKKFRRPF